MYQEYKREILKIDKVKMIRTGPDNAKNIRIQLFIARSELLPAIRERITGPLLEC